MERTDIVLMGGTTVVGNLARTETCRVWSVQVREHRSKMVPSTKALVKLETCNSFVADFE
jgi:hypothetical protein